MNTLLVETITHGRVRLQPATVAAANGILVGFHGYAENADLMMERLEAIPGADAWTLLSVQGLHRFYRGRSEEVVASWMTRQDRDTAIADNLRYVDAAVAAAGQNAPVVYAGFSQGVAMAYRAALLGRPACAGVIAVGGDIPPELTKDPALRFPPVLLVRGRRDEWFTQARFDADLATLTSRAPRVQPLVCDGGHEWGPDASAAAGAFLAGG